MNRSRLGWFAFFFALCCFKAIPVEAQVAPDLPGASSITLQQAIRMALDHAPELAAARAQAAQAGEALRETRALNLPQVVTGTGLAYNNGFPLSLEGSAPSLVQVGVSQSVLSKKNKHLILEASESLRASEIGAEAARSELVAKTALLYEELHQARRLVSLWSSGLEASRKQQLLTETLLEAGRVRPVDVILSRTATAHAGQQLLVAEEQGRITEAALREALGLVGGGTIETVEPRIEVGILELPAQELYQRALEIHPEIQRAEAELRARELHVEAEKGEFLPRMDLVGQYALFARFNNYQDFFNRFTRNNYILGLSVQVPLFNGFRTSARVARSRQAVAEARSRLESLRSDLKMDIERASSRLRIARGAVELAQMEAAAAEESLRVSRAQFEEGRVGSRETESAQARLREKEIALVEAERALWQTRIELLRLTGNLTTLF